MDVDAYPRLLAEASAFPVCSRAAQQTQLWCLSWSATGALSKDGRSLSDALINHLRLRANGLSLALLAHLRDLAWRPQLQPLHLATYLVRLATELLAPAGAQVTLKQEPVQDQQLERWRWISLCLPPDLLIAALYAPLRRDPPEDRVSLVPPRLLRVLEAPCAETHLHVGAAVPFGHLWGGLMRRLAMDEGMDWGRLGKSCRPGQPIQGEQDLRALLYGSALARLLIASFLRQRERGLGPVAPGTFDGFYSHYRSELWGRAAWSFGPVASERLLRHALQALALQTAPPESARVRSLYRHLLGLRAPKADPLDSWLHPHQGLSAPEVRLNRRALSYLLEETGDEPFHRIYFQYVRARCLIYRFLVEEPGTAGLDWFTQHYNRISPLRKAVDEDKYDIALREEARDLHLGALELRTAPEASWPLIRAEILDLAEAAQRVQVVSQPRPQVGLILHFIKKAEEGGHPVADPRSRAFGARYGVWCHARQREAWAISTALRYHPELMLVLRGVDIANLELAIPTWPVLNLFAHVREASEQAAALLTRYRPHWQAQPLRVTYHVGEDIRRLTEGLRRMHEPLQFGVLRPGDRIGHGLALGLDPHRVAEQNPTQAQPLEERLDDLLWELERYQRGDQPCEAGRLELVRAEALRLGRDQYGKILTLTCGKNEVTVDALIEARLWRHDRRLLEWLRYPLILPTAPSFVANAPAGQLLWRYLTDAVVYERGQRILEVPARTDESAVLVQAQRWLKGELARSGITIEGNPSSNLLIGRFGAIHEHPAFRFQPLTPDNASETVGFSLSTDNPMTFSTRLADEYAYVYDALCTRGVPVERALHWLDTVRDHGWRSRFTLTASTNLGALATICQRA